MSERCGAATGAFRLPAGGYRAVHQVEGHARDYDRDFWSPSSAKHLNWEIEKVVLDDLLARHLCGGANTAIDFACGTGRVLQLLEDRFARTIGIDISEPMLELAAPRCRRSRLICRDVTRQAIPDMPRPIQLVTAFRFFLNAEPELRRDILAWIREVLAPDGLLIANFHLNPRSLRGCYLRARWAGRPRVPMLSPRAVEGLLVGNGFEILERVGYEYLPYRRDGARLRAVAARRRVEHAVVGRPSLAGLGGCFLIAARPR